jgi:hypothetical protein
MAAFEEQTDRTDCLGVLLIRGQTFDAGSQATMDVILQAGMGVLAVEIHTTRGNLEVAMNKVDQPMRQVARKIRTIVGGAILPDSPRDVHARIFLRRQFDIWIRLVIAQQDVETRLPLLDQIVLKRQRFFVVVDLNEVDLSRFPQQCPGFDVRAPLLGEITPHAISQILRLADVQDSTVGVLIEVDSRECWQLSGFFAELRKRVYTLIVARVFLGGCFAACCLIANAAAYQQQTPNSVPPTAAKEQEPPEEDESLIPKEYVFNPLESARNLTAGNFYYKKGNYHAAARRYLEASRWDPTSTEALLKLATTNEKLRDLAAAREAYEKYLAASPDARNADSIKKKIAKWPNQAAKK